MIPTNRPSSSPVERASASKVIETWRLLYIGLCLAGLMSAANADGLCPGEMEKAAKMRQRIVQEWPLRPASDPVSQYVQNLGTRLAERSIGDGRSISWRFTLVRNLAPNAFSIGAGNVFINEGAVNFAQTESELAAILAHELAHELAGHFCEDTRPSHSLFDIFSAPEPRQYGADIGSLKQIIDPIKERQADQIALSLLRSAGFDPRAMLDVAKRLPSGGAVHFLDANRIQSLEQAVAAMSPIPTGSSEEFRAIKHILVSE